MPGKYKKNSAEWLRSKKLQDEINALNDQWHAENEKLKETPGEISNFHYTARMGDLYSRYGKADVKHAKKQLLKQWKARAPQDQRYGADKNPSTVGAQLPKKKVAFRELAKQVGIAAHAPDLQYKYTTSKDTRPIEYIKGPDGTQLHKNKQQPKDVDPNWSPSLQFHVKERNKFKNRPQFGYIERSKHGVLTKKQTEKVKQGKGLAEVDGDTGFPLKARPGYNWYTNDPNVKPNDGKKIPVSGTYRSKAGQSTGNSAFMGHATQKHSAKFPGFIPIKPVLEHDTYVEAKMKDPLTGKSALTGQEGAKGKKERYAHESSQDLGKKLRPFYPKRSNDPQIDPQGRQSFAKLQSGSGESGQPYNPIVHKKSLFPKKTPPGVNPQGDAALTQQVQNTPAKVLEDTPFEKPSPEFLPGDPLKRLPSIAAVAEATAPKNKKAKRFGHSRYEEPARGKVDFPQTGEGYITQTADEAEKKLQDLEAGKGQPKYTPYVPPGNRPGKKTGRPIGFAKDDSDIHGSQFQRKDPFGLNDLPPTRPGPGIPHIQPENVFRERQDLLETRNPHQKKASYPVPDATGAPKGETKWSYALAPTSESPATNMKPRKNKDVLRRTKIRNEKKRFQKELDTKFPTNEADYEPIDMSHEYEETSKNRVLRRGRIESDPNLWGESGVDAPSAALYNSAEKRRDQRLAEEAEAEQAEQKRRADAANARFEAQQAKQQAQEEQDFLENQARENLDKAEDEAIDKEFPLKKRMDPEDIPEDIDEQFPIQKKGEMPEHRFRSRPPSGRPGRAYTTDDIDSGSGPGPYKDPFGVYDEGDDRPTHGRITRRRRENPPPPPPDDYDEEGGDSGVEGDYYEPPRGGRGGGRGYTTRYGGNNGQMNQFHGGKYIPQGEGGWGGDGGGLAGKFGGMVSKFTGGLNSIANPISQVAGAAESIWGTAKDIFGINETREADREARAEETYQRRLAEAEALRKAYKEETEDERKRRIKQEKYDEKQRIKKVIADQYRATQASQYGQTNSLGTVDWEGNVADGTRRLVSKLDAYQQQKKDAAARMAGELSAKDAYGNTAKDVQSKVLTQWHRDNDQRLADEKKATQERLLARGFVEGSPAWMKAMKQVSDAQEKEIANVNDHATELGHKYGAEAFDQKLRVYEKMDDFKDPLGMYKDTSAIGTQNIKDAVMQSGELEHKRASSDADIINQGNRLGLDAQIARQNADAAQEALRSQHTLQSEKQHYDRGESERQRRHEGEMQGGRFIHEAGMQSARFEHESDEQYEERMLKREMQEEDQGFRGRESYAQRRHEGRLQEGRFRHESDESREQREHEGRLQEGRLKHETEEQFEERMLKRELQRRELGTRTKEGREQRQHEGKLQGQRLTHEERQQGERLTHEEQMQTGRLKHESREEYEKRLYDIEKQRNQQDFESRENTRKRLMEYETEQERLTRTAEENLLNRQQETNIQTQHHEFTKGEAEAERKYKLMFDRERRNDESQENYLKRMNALDILEETNKFQAGQNDRRLRYDETNNKVQRQYEAAENEQNRRNNQVLQQQKLEADAAAQADKQFYESNESAKDRQYKILEMKQKGEYDKDVMREKGRVDSHSNEQKFQNDKYLKMLDIKARQQSEQELYREEDRRLKNKMDWERSEKAIEFARKDKQAHQVMKIENEYKQKLKKLDQQHELLVNSINNNYASQRNSEAHKNAIDEANNAYTRKREGLDYKLDQARSVFDMIHTIYNSGMDFKRMSVQDRRGLIEENQARWRLLNDPNNRVSQNLFRRLLNVVTGAQAPYKMGMKQLAENNL
jgi:hypothetical protein